MVVYVKVEVVLSIETWVLVRIRVSVVEWGYSMNSSGVLSVYRIEDLG